MSSTYIVGNGSGDESTFALDSTEEYTELHVYPVKQIRMEDHPEITQMLTITPWGEGTLLLNLRHPLGQTNLKVRTEDLMGGLTELQKLLDN